MSETFAQANHLGPGGTLSAVIHGRQVTLQIVGVALSPEYVMAIAPSGINDDRRFGILWMEDDELAARSWTSAAHSTVGAARTDERAIPPTPCSKSTSS